MPGSGLSVASPRTAPRSTAIEVAATVRDLQPYQAVSSLELIHQRPDQVPFKLDWNEATIPPSPRVIEAITAFLGNAHHLNWYPVLNSTNLIERLARFHGVPGERLLITNGSDQALDTVCTTYLNPGDRVLVPSPTYTHFLVFAQTRGAEIVPFYGPDPFEPAFDGLLEAATRLRPRLLYLVNPNNPTGVSYTRDQVATLLAAVPETLVIVDEAYSEFAGVTCIDLLQTYSNLVITRTFSKAYGMAGLRIGYALAAPDVIRDMRRIFNPKSVNVLAQIGAMAALDDQAYLRGYLDEVERSKALLGEWLTARGLVHHVTPANYVMIRFERAPWVVRMLQEQGIYVRDRSSQPRLEGYVRFTVGTLDQTRQILERLGEVLDRLEVVAPE